MAALILTIVIHETKMQKKMALQKTMTASDVCEEIRNKLQDTLLKGLGKAEDYGLFIADKNDAKKGSWLDPEKSLGYYCVENNDSLEYRKRLRILRIRTLDNAVKALMVDDSHTVEQLMVPICQSLGISNQIEYSLTWDNRPKEEIEDDGFKIKLKTFDPNKKVQDAQLEKLKEEMGLDDVANWVDHSKTLREQGIVETEILTIKRKLFIGNDGNEDIDNPIQRNMQYEQAKQDILKGKQPVTEGEAVQFAALQFQIQFGDHVESKHKTGFLSKNSSEFLEQSYAKLGTKIEKKILALHKSGNVDNKKIRGMSEAESKMAYIKLARSLQTFGTTFFLVREQIPKKNKLEPRLIGVTKDGILRLDERTKEVMQTWPLESVKRWAATQNIFTIDFGEKSFYSVQTTEGDKIKNMVASYVDLMKKNEAREAEIAQGSEQDIMESDRQMGMKGAQTLVHGKQETQKPKAVELQPSQRALMTTIQNGKKALIDSIATVGETAEINGDLSSDKWKSSQLNSSKQNVVSQVSAMNAATAQLVLLSGQGVDADHDAIGAAVTTITYNMPELVGAVQMINSLMDDNGVGSKDLMDATRALCDGFANLFNAAQPNSPREGVFKAAREVGDRSKRVLYTIQEEDVEDSRNQNILNDLVKVVASTVAKMMEKAKSLAQTCGDEEAKEKIIGASTNCAMAANQLVACTQVVAPTIYDPVCQEQLIEAAKDVARSVEGCIYACRDGCDSNASLMDLSKSASDVSKALNDVISHVKGDHDDYLPEIMERILMASDAIFASKDSSEQIQQSRLIATATSDLIQALQFEIDSTTDPELKAQLHEFMNEIIKATSDMIEAAKVLADDPNNPNKQKALQLNTESLLNVCQSAVNTIRKPMIFKKLAQICKTTCGTATQCIAAAKGAEKHNSNAESQNQLMDSCKQTADVVPRIIEAVRLLKLNPTMAMAQLNLINTADQFIDPGESLIQSIKSTLPFVKNQSASLPLSNSCKQMENNLDELKFYIDQANQVAGALEVEATKDIIESLQNELEDVGRSAKRGSFRPKEGASEKESISQFKDACRSVGSAVKLLLDKASEGDEQGVSTAIRDVVNGLKNYNDAVRGILSTSEGIKNQGPILDASRAVLTSSNNLVGEAQKVMENPLDSHKQGNLQDAGKAVIDALNKSLACLPGHKELTKVVGDIDKWSELMESGNFKSSGKPYDEVTVQLRKAATKLNNETSNVVHGVSDQDKLAESTRRFGVVFNEAMEHSTDLISQTKDPDTRKSMIESLKGVTTNSKDLMTSAKTVSTNPLDATAKARLNSSSRDIADSMGKFINTCTSASPSQAECDNAIRSMQGGKHTLNNANAPSTKASYHQCLDIIKKQSKVMGEGMGKLGRNVKGTDHKAFTDALQQVAGAVNNLIEASAQSAYLVKAGEPTSKPGIYSLDEMPDIQKSVEALKDVCNKVSSTEKPPAQVMSNSFPMIVNQHGGILIDLCKTTAQATSKPANKEELMSIGKGLEQSCEKVTKELKSPPFLKVPGAAKELSDTIDKLLKYFESSKHMTQPTKIGNDDTDATKDIEKYGGEIVDRSSSMIGSVKLLVVNPNDKSTWQALQNTSNEVSNSIKKLIAEIEERTPGREECEDAMETLTMSSRELNNASLAAQNKNLERRQDKNIKQFTEQIQNAATQIQDKIPAVKLSSKLQAEKLGHSVTAFVSYFEPLATNSINFAKNMVSSKQQVMLLDKTKKVCWDANDLLNTAKECGGNYKATHLHHDIDEQSAILEASLEDLLDLVSKLAPNMGVMSNVVHSITEAVRVVDNYRPTGGQRDSSVDLVALQTDMMSLTKEIARKAQDVVVQSTKNPEVMGEISLEISNDYKELASDAKTASGSMANPDIGKKLRLATSDLGQALTELVKSTGACQSSPKDATLLRDVSENARNVTEKCTYVQLALNAANAGTTALENASESTLGVIADLETMIIFASAGTLENDTAGESFADHKKKTLEEASELVKATKNLTLRGADKQQDVAEIADGSVQSIQALSEAVKKSAGSLTSKNSESQVMLLTSVKDVATALNDLLQARKSMSGSKKDEETIAKPGQVMAKSIASLIKTIKEIEDENKRGANALEVAIDSIEQELNNFNSKDAPKKQFSAEDLIKATRPITDATTKAVVAGNNLKQDDIVAAANTGRKAICDLLVTCKAAAFASEKVDARTEALAAGNDVALQYLDLFKIMQANLKNGDSSNKQKINKEVHQIAVAVSELANKAQALKDGDWVDPNDPTFIAENELNNAAKSIEAAAAKLALLKPRREVTSDKDANQNLSFDECILEAANAIATATSALIKAASAAQKELVLQGKVKKESHYNTEDGQWSEGLVSAAKMVAAATNELCDAADTLVKGISSEEKLIGAAKQVASSTAQLVYACKVKAERGSEKQKRLESASSAVRKATDSLIKSATDAKEATEVAAEKRLSAEAKKKEPSQFERLRMKIQMEERKAQLERELQKQQEEIKMFNESNYK